MVDVTINLDQNSIYGQLNDSPKYIRQEPYVDENGIYVPVHPYVQEGMGSAYRCVMTKEMFVEAYNRYINKPKRKYKGGWKR